MQEDKSTLYLSLGMTIEWEEECECGCERPWWVRAHQSLRRKLRLV